MKTIGLLGGMSWESTAEYYRIINEMISSKLGNLHSAKILLYSFDFEEIVEKQKTEDWKALGDILAERAAALENAGADMVLICTNTMHKVADDVQSRINIPLVSIIDATAEEIVKNGIKKVGLLGTLFTMEDDFYRDGLKKYGIDVVVPDKKERKFVHDVIFGELCKGIIKKESKSRFLEIISKLVENGVEGIVLGCTEIPLLVKQEDVDIPIFDTTEIHARKAVEMAIS
ncbi:aspartate racemase [Archaeoglobus sulfaticallidus PM70-1]|uniref:Aspartate racemase n=1 Tax=Archaeoglobus sulfaticallidus PM70-1 TaxID=387631 RepID=N0BDF1_9EURY|nr:aspartate/glutamate racemase family protein [Archaeoglobus sulfaticallidus]AGK61659.1 aspartate racemase [Archaeoglobus sulfaticallidus PM70-1]